MKVVVKSIWYASDHQEIDIGTKEDLVYFAHVMKIQRIAFEFNLCCYKKVNLILHFIPYKSHRWLKWHHSHGRIGFLPRNKLSSLNSYQSKAIHHISFCCHRTVREHFFSWLVLKKKTRIPALYCLDYRVVQHRFYVGVGPSLGKENVKVLSKRQSNVTHWLP